MISLSFGGNTLELPQVLNWAKSQISRVAERHSFYELIVSFLSTATVFVVGVAMICVIFGVRLPLGKSSSKPDTLTISSHSVQLTPKPNLINASVSGKKNCAGYSLGGGQFSECPSFRMDFSKRITGVLDRNFFNVYVGPPVANNEAQYYSDNPRNIRIENGSLMIQAQNKAQQGYKYTSARIDTKGKEDFLYGKVVVRAILPSSIGTWPAIWMLPSVPKYASLSPASDPTSYLNDGEIDIAESIGSEPKIVYGVAHSLAYANDGIDRTFFDTIKISDNDTVFHDYAMEWTPTALRFSVDGEVYFSMTKNKNADYHSWPYDQPFYLVMNLALGGNWAGKDIANFPVDGVDSSSLPAALKIQSVEYYSYVGTN